MMKKVVSARDKKGSVPSGYAPFFVYPSSRPQAAYLASPWGEVSALADGEGLPGVHTATPLRHGFAAPPPPVGEAKNGLIL